MASILQNYIKCVDSEIKETRYKVQHKTQQQEVDNLAKNIRVQHRAKATRYLLCTY